MKKQVNTARNTQAINSNIILAARWQAGENNQKKSVFIGGLYS